MKILKFVRYPRYCNFSFIANVLLYIHANFQLHFNSICDIKNALHVTYWSWICQLCILQVGLVYLDICMHVDHNLGLFLKIISKNFTQVFVEYAVFLNFDLFSHELPPVTQYKSKETWYLINNHSRGTNAHLQCLISRGVEWAYYNRWLFDSLIEPKHPWWTYTVCSKEGVIFKFRS
jgi:hypothetical protein